ncbi:Xenobiotic-transporting ATPase protein [Dioscorea alata]|uniref:Xenobiotic-transporting ATPase protein n=1 Tax=Dioscorea alata TaxID=55571 RepID=A0ACB7W234_DIOAL|nr:Xenobiotic-transporting ATPase protein [Dioscorea alata]
MGIDDKKKQEGSVSYIKLFSFADKKDVALMAIGTIAAMASGFSTPLMAFIFGDLLNTFAHANKANVVPLVSKVIIKFVYLAIGSGVVSFLRVSCWIATGERQAARIRGLYLKSLLRQDIAFFDNEIATGEVIGRMSGDTILIQQAIGDKVGKFVLLVSTFFGGFIIAFIRGWHLSLVLMSSTPLIVITAGILSVIMSRLLTKGRTEYVEAGNVVEQTIGAIRTGLDTMVGEHGTQLSGGQKQRIAIARSILKNPKILLLDEATSALDVESERIVQAALVKVLIDRTTIIVAHRLGTVKNVDTISVVHSGKLVEQGSHDDLIKYPEGAYSQLVRLQENQKHDEEEPPKQSKNMVLSNDRITTIVRSVSHRSTRRSSSGGSFVISHDSSGEDDPIKALKKDESRACKQVSIKRLALLNKPEALILTLGSIAAIISGLVQPVFGLWLSRAIETFYEPLHELHKHANLWALRFLALGFVCFVVTPSQHYLFGMAGGKLIERVHSLSFERVLYQEISWFDEPSHCSGTIAARLSVDAMTVRSIVGDSLSFLVESMSTVITGLVIAMNANWKLACIVITLLPLLSVKEYAQMKFLKGFSVDAKVKYEEASQVANDAVGNIRTVASFCAEKRMMEAYQKKCEFPLRNDVRQGIITGLGVGFSSLVLYIGYAICFYVGASFIHHGSATFNEVFIVFYALTLATSGVSQASALGPDTNKAKDSTASIFEILDRKSKIDSSSDEGIILLNVRGDIVFQHVSFKYPTRPEVQIFTDLCLSVSSGKTLALVGESGSGKSTVIAMLQRFYDPDFGMILLDGVNLQDFKISWLRQQMGLVSQEPVLFNDTIRANIAYGKQGQVSEEEIIAAAEAANAHRFVSGLPQGYDTNVGERGAQLSGGQKQRIAIARAFLKDPKILLLDEATSALDAESESVVQAALDKVMVGRTTIVVSHRLLMVKGFDVIAVVKNGVIIEQGKHEVLIKIPDGVYSSIVALHSSSAS